LASSFATAIGEGYSSISSLSPELHSKLTESPWFAESNAALSVSLIQTAALPYAQEEAFMRDLDNWRRQEAHAARQRLEPQIDLEVEKWSEKRRDEFMAKAALDTGNLV